MEDLSGVAAFESEFADLVAVRHAVVVTSPAAALRLALQLVGVARDTCVVLPALFWAAGVPVVAGLDAEPVLADVDSTTGNLSPEALAARLSPRTRAVVVEDIEGIPADMDRLRQAASRVGAPIVEYVGAAAGAIYKGDPVGARADVALWSLKDGPLACGGGAVLTTNRSDWAAYARILRHAPLPSPAQLEEALRRGYGMYQATFVRRTAIERLRRELGAIAELRMLAQEFIGWSSGWSIGLELLGGRSAQRDALVEALRSDGVPAASGWGTSGALAPTPNDEHTAVAVRLQGRALRIGAEHIASTEGHSALVRALNIHVSRLGTVG